MGDDIIFSLWSPNAEKPKIYIHKLTCCNILAHLVFLLRAAVLAGAVIVAEMSLT